MDRSSWEKRRCWGEVKTSMCTWRRVSKASKGFILLCGWCYVVCCSPLLTHDDYRNKGVVGVGYVVVSQVKTLIQILISFEALDGNRDSIRTLYIAAR